MKRIILLLLATSLLFITSCELFMDEPTNNGKIYSVTIGLDYTNSSSDNLYGTINDAKELQQAFAEVALKDGREYKNYLMIQEGNTVSANYPSKGNVINLLEYLATITTEDDLTILTYSGHGVVLSGELVFGVTTPATDTYMSVTDLLTPMNNIPGKKLVILDSCFSGMFVEESPSSTNIILNNSIAKFFETYNSSDEYGKPDLFVLTASTNTESWEKNFGTTTNKHVHGIFTYALLEALGWEHTSVIDPSLIAINDPPAATFGQITVDGLFKYIKDNQAIRSSLSLFTAYQHPMTTGGPLDLVLFNL